MKHLLTPSFLFIAGLCLMACNSNSKVPAPLFKTLPSGTTGITFTNTVTFTADFNVFKYRNFYNGAGVAIGDINNDGLADVFFTANQGNNKLYLNKGNWKFEDITLKAGVKGIHKWHTGVTMADINADGWLDIYVCNSGDMAGDDKANELYINQKNGTFTEQAQQYGLDDKGLSTQAAFFDYDHDGDLDCYVLNNSYRPIESFGFNVNLRYQRDALGGHRLYKNDNGKFIDNSQQCGIFGSEIGFGLGITVGDVNNDGWDDIYVSNDFFEKDYLYINQKNGTFKEEVANAMTHISQASMGSDMIDMNNDGYLDIFTTDMLPESDFKLKTNTVFDDFNLYNAKIKNDFHHQFAANCLQLNNGDGTFSEIAAYAGVNATDWSWGALSFDFNNDGWKDLFVSNGISKDLTNQDFLNYFTSSAVINNARAGIVDFEGMLNKMESNPIANYGFINQKNLTFKNEAQALGLALPSFSNGAAYGDLDNDGDLDLVVNNENAEAFVYRNMATETLKTSYLKIKLKGLAPNTYGYGAKVSLYTKNGLQVLQQMPSRGFESSVEPVLNFGLGNLASVDSLVVLWPTMKTQTLVNIKSNTTLTLQQQNAQHNFAPTIPSHSWYKQQAASFIHGNTTHQENNFIDFNIERLIPKMLSTDGPKLAIADVNADGLNDFFLGAAKNDYTKLFLAIPHTGGFTESPQAALNIPNTSDNSDAVFFDSDNDGDQDLLVVYGGNEDKLGAITLIPHLFLNDGKGNFTRAAAIPFISINAACVRVCDFDKDGDIDVFIGARSIPGAYGLAPPSILLQNDGKGSFDDCTNTHAPELLNLGMVTDAQWADVDNDGLSELIIVGDWMPVTIFKCKNKKLVKYKTIPQSLGWWNCLTIADTDADGNLDIIAGNLGLNSKIKASQTQPANMYVNDFDKNGQSEPIAVYYKPDGKAYPFNLRADLVAQLPYLKKKFLRYDAYAGKAVEEVFTSTELNTSRLLTVNETRTCLFKNKGKGNFTKQPLPLQAQLSPVHAILLSDFNNDKIPDIFLGGNFYGLKPEVGRYDACYGVTFLGNKKHNFTYIKPTQSGLFVTGEVRDVKEIKQNNKSIIVVSRNNDKLMVFGKK
jgi:enediyne biosynthesis protein E4